MMVPKDFLDKKRRWTAISISLGSRFEKNKLRLSIGTSVLKITESTQATTSTMKLELKISVIVL